MQQELAHAAIIAHVHKQSSSTSLPSYLQRAEKQAIEDGSRSVRDAGSACANLNATQLQQCAYLYNKVFDETCPKSPEKCKE
ncbi:MAG TPA: hypothetical protein VEH06_17755 [Candidatus Bathyarchaeia archaeon]|nr:hypothetical protein [Candidatus Bathyarchaeia archaeon]